MRGEFVATFPTILAIAIGPAPLRRKESVHQSTRRSPFNTAFTMPRECDVVNERLARKIELQALQRRLP